MGKGCVRCAKESKNKNTQNCTFFSTLEIKLHTHTLTTLRTTITLLITKGLMRKKFRKYVDSIFIQFNHFNPPSESKRGIGNDRNTDRRQKTTLGIFYFRSVESFVPVEGSNSVRQMATQFLFV